MEKKVREREDQVARKFKADCAAVHIFILTSAKGNVRKEKR